MLVLRTLIESIRHSAIYHSDSQVAPACILWPDKDRQWEAIILRLQSEIPELLILGGYLPEKRTGPAIWLRCVIANKINEIVLPKASPPILYLPGTSRQDLRAVESCPDDLKPLAELQYRGVIWSQANAKDWTILAFLKSDQGGMGLDVAQDNETRHAMQLSLYRLLDEDVERLKGKRLDKDFFNTLLTGGDPERDLLQWLDQGDAFKNNRGENEWRAFVEVCKSQLAFNPQNEGILSGAAKLATHAGPWKAVWERFCEAPKRYPHIPEQIRKCKSPAFDFFADVDKATDFEAITAGIRSVYLPWAEDAARHLQRTVEQTTYPGGAASLAKSDSYQQGECVFFVDGLRFDTAKHLVELLKSQGFEIDEKPV